MKRPCVAATLFLLCLGAAACAARPTMSVPGIELEDPSERAQREAEPESPGDAALMASHGGASDPDSSFVHSRGPGSERASDAPQLPIHINDSWWSFRAQHLGITEEQARARDARMPDAPAKDFWDSQTSVEAVSVWTVLCNECHGGRRSVRDAIDMPAPAAPWGRGTGLFFGNRRQYAQMFKVVRDGVPLKEAGRLGMPAWRHILSNEMRWALLYFLEYQSGGVESRFPPSLYPRRPQGMGER